MARACVCAVLVLCIFGGWSDAGSDGKMKGFEHVVEWIANTSELREQGPERVTHTYIHAYTTHSCMCA
jgi:hypothetical protein